MMRLMLINVPEIPSKEKRDINSFDSCQKGGPRGMTMARNSRNDRVRGWKWVRHFQGELIIRSPGLALTKLLNKDTNEKRWSITRPWDFSVLPESWLSRLVSLGIRHWMGWSGARLWQDWLINSRSVHILFASDYCRISTVWWSTVPYCTVAWREAEVKPLRHETSKNFSKPKHHHLEHPCCGNYGYIT